MSRWWWAALSLLACSVPVENYGRLFAQASCEREQRCGNIAKAIDCAHPDLFPETFPQQVLLHAEQVSYSGRDGADCLQRMRDTTCATAVQLMPECLRAFRGTLGEGAPCQSAPSTCAVGLVCASSDSACGTCIVATGEGQTRTLDHPCDVGLYPFIDGRGLAESLCLKPRGLDQRCERGIPCERWLRCGDAGFCSFPEDSLGGRGEGPREAGEPCGVGQVPCKRGLRCEAERCTLLLSNGAPCGEDADCLSARCLDGRCTQKRGVGGPCTLDLDCALLDCVAGQCDGSFALCR